MPYFVGYATAFIYIQLGGTKSARFLNVSTPTSILIWTVTLGLLFVAVVGAYNERIPSGLNMSAFAPNLVRLHCSQPRTADCNWNNKQNLMRMTFDILTWSVGIALLTINGLLGIGRPITWILSRPAWTPIARVSYLTYLVRPIIIFTYAYSVNTQYDYSTIWYIITFLGLAMFSIGWATALHLFVEKPLGDIQKMYLR